MQDKFFLSTYIVRVHNSKKEHQLLDKFNQSEDFYTFLKNYLQHIFQNPQQKFNEKDDTTKIHLTLKEPAKFDDEKRIIYGYFQGGVSGRDLTIKDLHQNTDILKVNRKNHGSFREIFFYFKIPKTSKNGSLVVQRIGRYGVKGILDETLNGYLRELGYRDSRFKLSNVIHGKVFKEMLKNGNLKKVEFIKQMIPSTLEGYLNKNGNFEMEKGTLTTSIQTNTTLGDSYKQLLERVMSTFKDNRTRIEIEDNEYDEISFELELNGKKKTFYAIYQNRILPDIEVSSDLEYAEGEPTIKSVMSKCEELINDLIELKPNV